MPFNATACRKKFQADKKRAQEEREAKLAAMTIDSALEENILRFGRKYPGKVGRPLADLVNIDPGYVLWYVSLCNAKTREEGKYPVKASMAFLETELAKALE